nr:hypothetical protein CFP56_35639 [Quercus suber]
MDIGRQRALKASLPPSPRHGARKGLRTGKGLITPDLVLRLVTHKDYAVEMVTSIIKETDLDPYDTVPPTRGGEDTVNDETVDSTHTVEQEVETDSMVITQPVPGGPNGLPAENPTTADDLPTVNPTVLDALPS